VGLILIDSTVIVAFLDRDDALHRPTVARFRELLATEALTASVISYAEVMTGASLGHHEERNVDGFFETFLSELLSVDRFVAARAAALRGGRPSLAMPDALILATADLHQEIDEVLCADREWLKVRGLNCTVELIKP